MYSFEVGMSWWLYIAMTNKIPDTPYLVCICVENVLIRRMWGFCDVIYNYITACNMANVASYIKRHWLKYDQ